MSVSIFGYWVDARVAHDIAKRLLRARDTNTRLIASVIETIRTIKSILEKRFETRAYCVLSIESEDFIERKRYLLEVLEAR